MIKRDRPEDVHTTYVVDNKDLRCTRCKTVSDGATKTSGVAGGPGAGDFAVCYKCGELHQYMMSNGVLTFAKFNVEDIEDAIVQRDIKFLQSAIKSRNFKVKAAWAP